MELTKLRNNVQKLIRKNKFVFLVLGVGILLMLLPIGGSKTESSAALEHTMQNTEPSLEYRLSEILSKISGAGRVEVLLTYRSGEETVYQEDSKESSEDHSLDTVIVTDSERSQTGLIKQKNPPVCLGALVLCQGADDPLVKLSVVDAVSKITGLGANQISVVKMN